MLGKVVLTAAFALVSSASMAANCDPVNVQTNMISCKNACNSSGHQPECNGSGTMDNASRSGDGAGVVRGFEVCHPDRMGSDQTKDEIAEACYNSDSQSVVKMACAVYGHCAPPPPPPPPVPTLKNIDFNQPMHPASDDKNIVVADFVLPGQGEYRSVTLNFTRDNINLFSLSTYAVNFDETGGLHLKITTYDKSVADVSKHTYSVAGTLSVTTPQ